LERRHVGSITGAVGLGVTGSEPADTDDPQVVPAGRGGRTETGD
jgi:hypothetical protein